MLYKRTILAGGLTALAVVALALSSHMKVFTTTYAIPKDSCLTKNSCGVCHVGKTKVLNPYGLALDKEMKAQGTKKLTVEVLKKVAQLDSDGDGKTNEQEIKADRLPGDPKN